MSQASADSVPGRTLAPAEPVASPPAIRSVHPRRHPRVEHAALTLRLTRSALSRFASERILGLAWWVVDPILMIAVYVMVFSVLLELPGREASKTYALFLACGLIPWRWFAMVTTRGALAFQTNSGLLISMPVNRGAVVMGEVAASTIEALLGVPILITLMLWMDRPVTVNLLWLPVPLLVMGIMAAGVALLLCPLNVLMRDVSNAHAAFLRTMWFLSPGLYSITAIPEQYRMAYAACNPFVGLLEGVRRPIHDGLPPLWEPLMASGVWAVVLFLIGLATFRRTKDLAVRRL